MSARTPPLIFWSDSNGGRGRGGLWLRWSGRLSLEAGWSKYRVDTITIRDPTHCLSLYPVGSARERVWLLSPLSWFARSLGLSVSAPFSLALYRRDSQRYQKSAINAADKRKADSLIHGVDGALSTPKALKPNRRTFWESRPFRTSSIASFLRPLKRFCCRECRGFCSFAIALILATAAIATRICSSTRLGRSVSADRRNPTGFLPTNPSIAATPPPIMQPPSSMELYLQIITCKFIIRVFIIAPPRGKTRIIPLCARIRDLVPWICESSSERKWKETSFSESEERPTRSKAFFRVAFSSYPVPWLVRRLVISFPVEKS